MNTSHWCLFVRFLDGSLPISISKERQIHFMSVCSISFVQSIIHVELQRKKNTRVWSKLLILTFANSTIHNTVNVLSTVELACSTNPKRRSVRNKISVIFTYTLLLTHARIDARNSMWSIFIRINFDTLLVLFNYQHCIAFP